MINQEKQNNTAQETAPEETQADRLSVWQSAAESHKGSARGDFYEWCAHLSFYSFFRASRMVNFFEEQNFSLLEQEAQKCKNAGVTFRDRGVAYAHHAAGCAGLQLARHYTTKTGDANIEA